MILLVQVSCQQNNSEEDSFNDRIALLESNPILYLSKFDSIQIANPKNEKEATNFLLVALAKNYVNNYYPSKELLQKVFMFSLKINSHRNSLNLFFPS